MDSWYLRKDDQKGLPGGPSYTRPASTRFGGHGAIKVIAATGL